MDLLGREPKQEVKGKKAVLILLIISVILLILILVMIYALKGQTKKTLGLNINGQDVQITENMIISNDQATYISLENLSSYLGYDYLRGGYLEYVENENKCYLESKEQIIGFEVNSNQIYKTVPNSTTDYQYYKLRNNVVQQNGILYIALEDLNVACNVIYTFDKTIYKIIISDPENLTASYAESFLKAGFTIDDNPNNKKTMAYNMVVVSNESNRMGVVDWNANSIIGNKYTTMEFNEFAQNFIVSNDNKYGVISKEGKVIQGLDLKYDMVEIINYSPLLYEVKLNNKFGVLDQNGNIIVNVVYDNIGFKSNSNIIESTLIIKNIGGQDGIVVCKSGKYGIVSLKTGQMIIDCNVDKIYSKTSIGGEKVYFIELQNTEIELARYIEHIRATTVVTNR